MHHDLLTVTVEVEAECWYRAAVELRYARFKRPWFSSVRLILPTEASLTPSEYPSLMEYADQLPDEVCRGCGFSGFIHRETFPEQTIVEGVDVGMIEKTVLVCSACYGRERDRAAFDWRPLALARYAELTGNDIVGITIE